MAKFKNISIKKKGGGTRLQRVKVLASGKYKFVKNLRARISRSRPSTVKTSKTRSVRSMGKKKRRGRRNGMTIPLAPVMGLVAGVGDLVPMLMAGKTDDVIHLGVLRYTGYNTRNQQLDLGNAGGLQRGLVPLIIGLMVHKFVGGRPLNLNRALASAGVPFIRI